MGTDDQGKQATRRAQGRRLAEARKHLNYGDAAEAARKLKLGSVITYQHHENGTRGISRAAELYAEKFGVPEEWLLYGRNPPEWARPEMELSDDERRGGAEHFLRAWRLHRNMTVADLADLIRAAPDMVEAWEAGTNDISDKWLRRLADALDTTPGSILDADPETVAPSVLSMWHRAHRAQRETQKDVATARAGSIEAIEAALRGGPLPEAAPTKKSRRA